MRKMRIEVTDYDEKPRTVDIDFEVGATLVNLRFSKAELENLHGVVVGVLEGWADEDNEKAVGVRVSGVQTEAVKA